MSHNKKSQSSKRRGRRSSKTRATVTPAPCAVASGSFEMPSFVEPCDKLLKQVTVLDDCKSFLKSVSTHDAIYREYHKLIASPISFKSVAERLHQKPCWYHSYEEFAADVKKIFDQEKRLKSHKGGMRDTFQKRMLMASRARNYWNTLIAPYEQYGFDAVENHKNNTRQDADDDDDDDRKLNTASTTTTTATTTTSVNHKTQPQQQREQKEEREGGESMESNKKRKQTQKVLSNLKKRVQRSELPSTAMEMMAPQPPSNKRRKLNSAAADHGQNDKAEKEDDEEEEQEREQEKEKKKEKENEKSHDPLLLCYDTPFTPFAAKSRVFRQMMGSTTDVFESVQDQNASHPRRDQNGNVKKQLHFIPSQAMYENNMDAQQKVYEFVIKFKNYDRLFKFQEPSFYECAAPRMEVAVDMFRKTHENCNIISVTMGSLDD